MRLVLVFPAVLEAAVEVFVVVPAAAAVLPWLPLISSAAGLQESAARLLVHAAGVQARKRTIMCKNHEL